MALCLITSDRDRTSSNQQMLVRERAQGLAMFETIVDLGCKAQGF